MPLRSVVENAQHLGLFGAGCVRDAIVKDPFRGSWIVLDQHIISLYQRIIRAIKHGVQAKTAHGQSRSDHFGKVLWGLPFQLPEAPLIQIALIDICNAYTKKNGREG